MGLHLRDRESASQPCADKFGGEVISYAQRVRMPTAIQLKVQAERFMSCTPSLVVVALVQEGTGKVRQDRRPTTFHALRNGHGVQVAQQQRCIGVLVAAKHGPAQVERKRLSSLRFGTRSPPTAMPGIRRDQVLLLLRYALQGLEFRR